MFALLWWVRGRLMGWLISVMHFGGWHRLWWLTPHVRQITCERQERDVGEAGEGLCTLWGHGHLSRKVPWCWCLYFTPTLVVGGWPAGRGCFGALGVPLPTQGCGMGMHRCAEWGHIWPPGTWCFTLCALQDNWTRMSPTVSSTLSSTASR